MSPPEQAHPKMSEFKYLQIYQRQIYKDLVILRTKKKIKQSITLKNVMHTAEHYGHHSKTQLNPDRPLRQSSQDKNMSFDSLSVMFLYILCKTKNWYDIFLHILIFEIVKLLLCLKCYLKWFQKPLYGTQVQIC